MMHVCRHLLVDSLVVDLRGLLDLFSVRDLILRYSSMGIARCAVSSGTPSYPYSGLVVDLRESVLIGSLT